jgi:hypothetical protein
MANLKILYRASFCLLICILLGCEDREALPVQAFYPFSSIARIDISVSDSIYKLYVSQPVEIIPKIYDKDGKLIYLPDSLIAFTVNEESLTGRSVVPPDTGNFVVKAKVGNIESQSIRVRSLDLIRSIEVRLSRPVFYLREETTPIIVSATCFDTGGAALKLTDSTQLKILIDGTPVVGNSVLPVRAGDYKVQIRLRQHQSTTAILPAVDPNNAVKAIRLKAFASGGTHLGVANKSTRFNLQAEVLGKDDRPVPLSKELRFFTNGSALADASFTTSTAGTYTLQARGYGAESVPVSVIMRPEQFYSVVKLPIILHFLNQPVPSQSDLDNLLANVNKAFRGVNLKAAEQDLNAVDSYVEFEWATRAPDGTLLERPGVHAVTTGPESITDREVGVTNATNPCWNNFWNPNKFLNVWVIKVSDGPWGGLGSLPYWADAPIAAPPSFLVGTWVNSTSNLTYDLLVHEFGHNLGLFHTFNGNPVYGVSITPEGSCARDSDECEDTPNYHRGAEVDFSTNKRVSCQGGEFQSTNYMDYGPGNSNSFTYDQRKIIRQTVEKAVWLPIPRNRNARLAATGAAPWVVKPPVILP